MVSRLEQIVRPFQLNITTLPQREQLGQQPFIPVRLRIGLGGSGKSFQGSYHVDAKWYVDLTTQEITER